MSGELAPILPDPHTWDHAYVYVVGWHRHQHRDATRRGRMPWFKVYTALLHDDEFQALSTTQVVTLLLVWLLTAELGWGRVSVAAVARHQLGRGSTGGSAAGWRGVHRRNLVRLNHAGWIEVRAGKAPAERQPPAGLDVDRDHHPSGGGGLTATSESGAAAAEGAAAPEADDNGDLAGPEHAYLRHLRGLARPEEVDG